MTPTPGPWYAVARASDNTGQDDYVLGWDVQGPPEAQRGTCARAADARLMAASPELLVALRDFTEWVSTLGDTMSSITRRQYAAARAAIAKAEGLEP